MWSLATISLTPLKGNIGFVGCFLTELVMGIEYRELPNAHVKRFFLSFLQFLAINSLQFLSGRVA